MNKGINYNVGKIKYLLKKTLLKWRPLVFNNNSDLDAVLELLKWAMTTLAFFFIYYFYCEVHILKN